MAKATLRILSSDHQKMSSGDETEDNFYEELLENAAIGRQRVFNVHPDSILEPESPRHAEVLRVIDNSSIDETLNSSFRKDRFLYPAQMFVKREPGNKFRLVYGWKAYIYWTSMSTETKVPVRIMHVGVPSTYTHEYVLLTMACHHNTFLPHLSVRDFRYARRFSGRTERLNDLELTPLTIMKKKYNTDVEQYTIYRICTYVRDYLSNHEEEEI